MAWKGYMECPKSLTAWLHLHSDLALLQHAVGMSHSGADDYHSRHLFHSSPQHAAEPCQSLGNLVIQWILTDLLFPQLSDIEKISPLGPLSASTRAPPSRVHLCVTGSFQTLAVRPMALAPWPVAKTAQCAVFSTYLRNWDFAVPGSLSSRTLMSPRRRCFLLISFSTLLNKLRVMAVLISLWP